MSYTRAYFPLLEVRHRVDPITINIPISTRFRVHIGTISLHGKVQMDNIKSRSRSQSSDTKLSLM